MVTRQIQVYSVNLLWIGIIRFVTPLEESRLRTAVCQWTIGQLEDEADVTVATDHVTLTAAVDWFIMM